MTRAYNTATTQQNSGGAVNPFVAGKNKIINGDFAINQRNFSSITGNGAYGFDRWCLLFGTGTVTNSLQTFAPGTAPVAGYEATNFCRLVTSGQSSTSAYAYVRQAVEDVRTFAGQTITVSFWAKSSTGTPNVGVSLEQYFGAGGSSGVNTASAAIAITSSWARYSATLSVPSVSGKTIAAGSFLSIGLMTSVGTTISALGYPPTGVQNVTIDFWGVQAEVGSVATPFQTATGTIQGELAACQRYYFRNTGALMYYGSGGIAGSTTQCYVQVKHPTTMRVAPTSLDYSLLLLQIISGSTNVTSASISKAQEDLTLILANTAGGLTATTQSYMLMSQNNAAAYIGLSAEL